MATFTNQATLSYNDTITNSNIVTGELLEVLTLTKTAVVPQYDGNGTVTKANQPVITSIRVTEVTE